MRLRTLLLTMLLAAPVLLMATPAHALPIAAAIVSAIGLTGTVAAVATYVITTALTLAVQVGLSKLMAPKVSGQERQASVLQVSLGETPREAIFGRATVGGSLVDTGTYGGSYGTDWEWRCIALADHPLDALEGYYIGEEYHAYSGNGLQSGFSGALDIEFVNATLAGASAPARFNSGWPSGDKLSGVARVWVAYKADEAVWKSGRPVFRWKVRGKRCYDPRKDSTVTGGSGAHRWTDPTTWEWTENAAICRYNWVRGIYASDQVASPQHLLIGRGLSAVEAPPERVFSAANVCDEAVTLKAGGTEPRYRVGGVVQSTEPFDTVEEHFAAAMAGTIVQREGLIEIEPGASKATVAEITDDDLVVGEKVIFESFLSGPQRVNTVVPSYIEPAQNWAYHAAPPRRSLSDITADGEAKDEPLSLVLVTSGTQAQRIGEIQRRLNRMERRASIVLPPRFAGLEEGDWIGWTSSRRHAGARVVYRVERWGRNAAWRKSLVLREVNASAYSWTAATDEITPGAALPPGPTPPASLALSGVTIEAIQLAGNNTLTPAIKFTWTVPVDPGVKAVRAEIRIAGDAEVGVSETQMVAAGEMIVTNAVASSVNLEARLLAIGDPTRDVTVPGWTTVTAGQMQVAKAVGLGEGGTVLIGGVPVSVSASPRFVSVSDGDIIDLDPPYPSAPIFEFLGDCPIGLSSTQTFSKRIEGASGAGGTVRLKVVTAGTPTYATRTDGPVTTPAAPDDFRLDKGVAADAYNYLYNVEIQGQRKTAAVLDGDTYIYEGGMVVAFYTKSSVGGAYVQRGSISVPGNTSAGIHSFTRTGAFSVPDAIGQHAGQEFRATVASRTYSPSDDKITSLKVSFQYIASGTPPTESTATPNGEALVLKITPAT